MQKGLFLPRPKKHWGQHFLQDQGICQRIVHALGDTHGYEGIIEVGPGRGALTEWLVREGHAPLYLVEVDPAMVTYLGSRYPELKPRLVAEDFLQLAIDDLVQGEIALIGNLPYNVASQLLLHALEYRGQISRMVCMVQKEVAERIVSAPGSKRYGLLSVWLQAFYRVSYVLEVPPEAFTPRPRVMSAVLAMDRHRARLPCDAKAFFRVVKAAFQQRRKVLSNALSSLPLPLDGIPVAMGRRRAEELSVDDFVVLTQALGGL